VQNVSVDIELAYDIDICILDDTDIGVFTDIRSYSDPTCQDIEFFMRPVIGSCRIRPDIGSH
jgi:hypothetical protein